MHSNTGQQVLKENITGAAQGGLNSTNLKAIQIPLPPMDVQQKIVDEIEEIEKQQNRLTKLQIDKTKEIDDIVENCCKEYSFVKLKAIVSTNPSKNEVKNLNENISVSFIDMPSVNNKGFIEKEVIRSYSEVKKGSYTYFKKGDIIIAKITPCMENGKCFLFQYLPIKQYSNLAINLRR